jgi:hypothetical protein
MIKRISKRIRHNIGWQAKQVRASVRVDAADAWHAVCG